MAFEPIAVKEKDTFERMVSRTLLQFRESPVFIDVLLAIGQEVKLIIDTAIEVIRLRGPADAFGSSLDSIGNIVGQIRTLIGYSSMVWFTPDREETRVDFATAWVKNAPTAGDYTADDGWFRNLIEAKVSRNFIKYSSVPEIQAFVRQAFGIPISIIRTTNMMEVVAVVPDDTPFDVVLALESVQPLPHSENAYFLPLPAGCRLTSVLRMQEYLDTL